MSNVERTQRVTVSGELEKELGSLIKKGYGMYFIRSDTTGSDMGIYITPEGHNLI